MDVMFRRSDDRKMECEMVERGVETLKGDEHVGKSRESPARISKSGNSISVFGTELLLV
jgi:hypothetical protein